MSSRAKPEAVNPIRSAEKLIEKYEIDKPAVPVERIAKREGARVQYGPLDKELSGMFFIKDDIPIIGVNSLHHPNRQRFTIGHELGHMMLHRDMLESGMVHVDKEFAILRRDALAESGTDQIEIEANRFSANLLVPDALLDAVIGDNLRMADSEQEIEALAKKFKVSAMTLQFRLQNWLRAKGG